MFRYGFGLSECFKLLIGSTAALLLAGCAEPSITAVNLNDSKAPEGIPYYLPKPYLIVCKNVRYIPTPTVGLTETVPIPNSFDSSNLGSTNGGNKGGGQPAGGNPPKAPAAQTPAGGDGDAKPEGALASETTDTSTPKVVKDDPAPGTPKPKDGAATSSTQVSGPASIAVVPPASIPDGLSPDTFYTYQIVYLPDLTQKYGLRVKGGTGEMRTTLNLVNGWMHTGPGPLYFRDSSTAQNLEAGGTAVSGFLSSAASFVSSIYGIPSIGGGVKPGATPQGAKGANATPPPTMTSIANYAQIWIYEPVLIHDSAAVGGQRIKWELMTGGTALSMAREVIAATQGQGGGGTGEEPTSATDDDPKTTDAANTAIHQLGLDQQGIKAVRTTKTASGLVVTVNKDPGKAARDKLRDSLKAQNIIVEIGVQ